MRAVRVTCRSLVVFGRPWRRSGAVQTTAAKRTTSPLPNIFMLPSIGGFREVFAWRSLFHKIASEMKGEPVDDAPLVLVDLRKQRQSAPEWRSATSVFGIGPGGTPEPAARGRRMQRHVMKRRADVVRFHPRDQLGALLQARQQHVVEMPVVGAGVGHDRRAQPAIPNGRKASS